MCVKKEFKICITLKKNDLLWRCFRIEEIRDDDYETGLKEREVIEIKTTVLHSLFVFILTLLHLNILLFDINLRTMTNPTCSVP